MKARIKDGYNAFYQTLVETENAPNYGIPDGARVEVVEMDEKDIHVKYKTTWYEPHSCCVEAWIPRRFVELKA